MLIVVFLDGEETILRPDCSDDEEEEVDKRPAFFSVCRLFWNHMDTVLTSLSIVVSDYYDVSLRLKLTVQPLYREIASRPSWDTRSFHTVYLASKVVRLSCDGDSVSSTLNQTLPKWNLKRSRAVKRPGVEDELSCP